MTHVGTSLEHVYVRWWMDDSWYGQRAGQFDRLWIMDVHGQRLVIVASWFPGTSPRARGQIDDIVASISIT